MNNYTITTTHDAAEQMTIITVNQGRASIVLRCYDDDSGAGIIDIMESTPGMRPRRLAFVADGEEARVYGLDQFGRERIVPQPIIDAIDAHHPTPESIQSATDRAEYQMEEC